MIYFKHASSLLKAPPYVQIGNSIKHRHPDSKQFKYLIKWAVADQYNIREVRNQVNKSNGTLLHNRGACEL